MHKFRHVMNIELIVKPFAVPHHSGRFQAQRIGNLVGGLTGSDQPENGGFLLRQENLNGGFIVFHKAHFKITTTKIYIKRAKNTTRLCGISFNTTKKSRHLSIRDGSFPYSAEAKFK